MNFFLIFILSSFAFAKTISMKDLATSSDISDIKMKVEKPKVVKVKIELGPEPLNISPKMKHYPVHQYRPMLSHDQLLKSQPSPESVGRQFPGYGPAM